MKLIVALALLAASAVWAADPVPMDVKTGEWETTVNSQFSGVQNIPQLTEEQLSRIPAEQRARLEALMKQASNRTITTKGCVKKEDLTKLPFNSNNCKTTVVSSSATKQVVHLDCNIQGAVQAADMTIEAQNSESVKFVMHSTGAATLNISGTSKWLSSTCTDAK